VLSAVQSLAVGLRKALGDTPRATGSETLTSSSLEAVREYSIAQDLASAGRHEDAIVHYRAAVERDSKFGRAYSGWATAAFYLGRKDEAEAQWKKALALMSGMTEREKYRTLGTYYLGIPKNYDKAIENYSALLRLYPTDLAGHNNLAFAYFSTLNFAEAREEGDKARRLYPKNVLIGNNAALYAMYAGDFTAAADQAKRLVELQPGFFKNYLPLAIAALRPAGCWPSRGSTDEARAIARELGSSLEPQPRACAKIVEAEVAMHSGQWADPVDALHAAIRLADLWLARFDLGVAYVRAGHEVEGLGELEACAKRRGEATALFLDDTPTFHVLAPLPYWLGRAQEGAGEQAAASRSYEAFLKLRPDATADPLAADARKRMR
jgi:tetratricopeptide (TPR) repeat protein